MKKLLTIIFLFALVDGLDAELDWKKGVQVDVRSDQIEQTIKDEVLKRYLLEGYLSKMSNRPQIKYHIQIIKPNTNIDYKLLKIEPTPGVEYKMRIIDPLTIPEVEITIQTEFITKYNTFLTEMRFKTK